jgi:hypothetical protein
MLFFANGLKFRLKPLHGKPHLEKRALDVGFYAGVSIGVSTHLQKKHNIIGTFNRNNNNKCIKKI